VEHEVEGAQENVVREVVESLLRKKKAFSLRKAQASLQP
jgi:hypothetical protein